MGIQGSPSIPRGLSEVFPEDDGTHTDSTSEVPVNLGSLSQPKCARCKNHNVDVELRGQKRFCRWRECSCILCVKLKEKQKIMAEQVSLRRQQDEEERRGILILKPGEVPDSGKGPHCTCYRNHGFNGQLKGHKHGCPFRNCSCQKCKLIKDRSL